jgi:hypothetical protein
MLKQPESEIVVEKHTSFNTGNVLFHSVRIEGVRGSVKISQGVTEKATLKQAKRRLLKHVREIDSMIEEEENE